MDSNVSFCYIKATEGANFKDPKCVSHFKKARERNLNIGLYHYFRTDVSATKQFDNFKQVYDKLESNLIPMIDVEEMGNDFSNTKKLNKQLWWVLKISFELCFGYF